MLARLRPTWTAAAYAVRRLLVASLLGFFASTASAAANLDEAMAQCQTVAATLNQVFAPNPAVGYPGFYYTCVDAGVFGPPGNQDGQVILYEQELVPGAPNTISTAYSYPIEAQPPPPPAVAGDGGNAGCTSGCNNGTNPVNSGWRGNKFQAETDYQGAGPYPLRFERFYNSRDPQIPGLATSGASDVVGRWRHTYQRAIVVYNNGANAAVYRPDGKIAVYTASGNNWLTDPHIADRLTRVADAWQFVTADDEIETYDSNGVLRSIRNRAGLTQTLTYDLNGLLISVADSFGRTLTFTYSGNNLATMTDPAGGVFSYAYSYTGKLKSVTYPDAKTRTYLYQNSIFPKVLTGITDENGNRFATWTYDEQGRAVSSEHGATGSGIDKNTITYYSDGNATITDTLNTTRTFLYLTQFGVVKSTGVSRLCVTCDGGATAARTYDSSGFVSSRTDFKGVQTIYLNDTRGLESSRTEAANTPLARTITTAWHPTFRLPSQIDEPGRRTTFGYDAAGNLLQKSVTDTVTNVSRVWTYTYNARSQLLTADGPRSDVNDVTTYAYDDATGNLTSVTNALGHVTRITDYNAHGQPLSIIDPNGLVTTLTYDVRGRLTARLLGANATSGELTTYTYDNAGQLSRVTLPNGAYLAYTFDAAHRLTQIQDQLGNKIVYTLDNVGNRTQESVYDPANNLAQTRSRVFDALNRLQQDIGGANPGAEITRYGYDIQRNLATITDPLNQLTTHTFDALNRLAQTTDPNNGQTNYGYTALDQLGSITDPRNLTTGYRQDALGDTTQIDSPDAGVTQTQTDAAGNVISRKDAKGQTTTYQFDALNRLTKETRADGNTVTYTYDAGASQKGRLSKITDPSGSTTWQYDLMGRVIQKDQAIGSVTLSTKYAFDTIGQLASITYPSGKVINYVWSNGQIVAVKLGTTNIASDIVYQPFGPVKSWTFQNGEAVNRLFDLNGRMTQNNLGTIGYDAAGRITSAYGRTYGYDNLDRLTSYQDGSIAYSYSLDATGNRTQQVVGSTINNYAIDANSNKILSISAGRTTKTYSHDANGSITSDGTYTLVYDSVNRLIQAKKGKTVNGTYSIDGLGQRVKKVVGSAITLFAHDETGRLLGEYNGSAVIQETVWLGDIPIATIRGGTVYYVHTDHLNTPRKVTDGNKKARWIWDVPSFGATTPNENPSKAGTFQYNLRFWGQYFDAETGLHQNYFRDCYDPKTGRYCQVDPIGLRGGLNVYRYANANPLSFTDPLGLMSRGECKKLKDDIYRKNGLLENELAKYDPVLDGQGGFIMKYGSGVTKAGGHYQEIRDLQRGIKKDLARYNKECKCDDDDDHTGPPTIPITRNVDRLANTSVPEPVYPSSSSPSVGLGAGSNYGGAVGTAILGGFLLLLLAN